MKISIKGLTWEYQTIMFLGFVIIALIIGFVFWFYIAHNRYERMTEQNFKMLATAIDQVCEDGSAQELTFYSPQITGFKGQIAQMINTRFANLGDVVGGLLGTRKIGEDPYFYVYYERFPPEEAIPPGVNIIAPWREDLPWSSNLMSTMFFDSVFLGFDFGAEKIFKQGIKKVKNIFKEGAESAAEKIVDGVKKTKGIRGLVEFFEEGSEIKVVKKIGGASKTIIKAAPKVAGLTAMCYFFTDQDIENCAVYATIGYTSFRIIKDRAAPYAWKRLDDYLYTRKLKLRLDQVGTIFKRYGTDLTDEQVRALQDEGVIKEVIEKGTKKYYVVDEAGFDALKSIWEKEGKDPDLIKGAFVYETKGEELKRIVLDKTRLKGPVETLENGFNKAKQVLSGKVGINPKKAGVMSNVARDMPFSRKRSLIIEFQERGLAKGIDVNNIKQVEKFWDNAAETWRRKFSHNSILFTGEKDGFGMILDNVEAGSTFSKEFDWYLTGLSGEVDNSYAYLAKHTDEYEKFYELTQGGVDVRITDEIKEKIRKYPVVGYTWLRFQDMYTIWGGTYWDMQISPYHLSIGACAPESLCLTTGSVVGRTISRKLENCAERGYDVRLDRDSIVATDPKFYLVSPCFSNLRIYRSGDTVYVKPTICQMNKVDEEFTEFPNYCYATAPLVNYYWGSEVAEFATESVVTVLCIIGNAPLFGSGSFMCTYAGDLAAMFFDIHRETAVNYPYVEDWILLGIHREELYTGGCGALVTSD